MEQLLWSRFCKWLKKIWAIKTEMGLSFWFLKNNIVIFLFKRLMLTSTIWLQGLTLSNQSQLEIVMRVETCVLSKFQKLEKGYEKESNYKTHIQSKLKYFRYSCSWMDCTSDGNLHYERISGKKCFKLHCKLFMRESD